MMWEDFFCGYVDWAESTVRSRISSLEDIGSGDEVVEVIIDLPSDKLKAQLIRKAMRYEVQFTQDDFMNLDGELPDEVYRELAEYTGFDADDPYLDEDNLEWDDFYNSHCYWTEADTLRRIGKLKSFGPADEVCDAVCWMPNAECEEALYKKAVSHGVKFTDENLENMGRVELEVEEFLANFISDEVITQLEHDVDVLCRNLDRMYPTNPPKPQKKGLGFLGVLSALFGAFSGAEKDKKDSGHCDGNCANCPPHYGYRYGRWYYGHGHQYSCQRGGNGGASGCTYKD